MKKINIKFLSILTITVLIFSSCKKDRTCECRITESSTLPGQQSDVYLYDTEYEKVTKKWMKNSAGCVSKTETGDDFYYDFNSGIEIPYTTTIQYDCKIN
jgi:hypothetical protein